MSRHRVVLSHWASRDIRGIGDFLYENASPRAAVKVVEQLLAAVGSLEDHAQRGSMVDELSELGQGAARQIVSKPYRIIYHVGSDRVLVLMVCDGRRNVASLVQQRMLGWPA